ncbi:glycosyltransferase family 2 protein [Flavobacterium foetidum]|uniref:glycosyltransferase family 2 protein n=1 Tax=Flavobacterium foetidum TaxID=2026681 RepID=UPI0010756C74|nr:glycosyltransferase [Flavobacterium foetidum]KAF2513536.1 glycosyltransferase [Flavobacterium foetidum]
MLVSVIIPIYNVEQHIKRCLFSVLNQSYNNIEIILVNDCTLDNSMKIVDDILLSRPDEKRVKIMTHFENEGLSVARNTAIKIASGDYIYFLDSDDEITIDCIEFLVQNCKDEDFVVGGFLKGDRSPYFPNVENKFEQEAVAEAYFKGKIYDMACNKLVKKEFIISNELFFKPRLVHEDILWTYQCCMLAQSVRIIEKSTYLYFIQEDSLNSNFTNRNLKNLEEIYSEIKKDIILKNKDKNLLANTFLINFIIGIKIRAVRSSILTFSEFSKIILEPIDFECKSIKLKLKYFFLKSPFVFQYFMIKILTRILPS